MASHEDITINFEAELMQGYNNPEIEIVSIEIDDKGVKTNITFEHLVKILSRSVFPIAVLWKKTIRDKTRVIAPLAYIDGTTIIFRSAMPGLCGIEYSKTGDITPIFN